MREYATLRLDSGYELRVELDVDDLDCDEIVVRRTANSGSATREVLLAVVDEHLATAERHAAGTTDRLLAADRQRPF